MKIKRARARARERWTGFSFKHGRTRAPLPPPPPPLMEVPLEKVYISLREARGGELGLKEVKAAAAAGVVVCEVEIHSLEPVPSVSLVEICAFITGFAYTKR